MHKTGFGLMAAAWLVTATISQAQEKAAELPALKIQPGNQVNGLEVLPTPAHLEESAEASCPQKSCWKSFCDWLTYHPVPPPRHCFHCAPIPRHPPLYHYFLDRAIGRPTHSHCNSEQ